MAEPIVIDSSEVHETEVVKTSRLKNFRVNHPRTAKVVGIVAVTAATFGALAWKNGKKDADTPEDSNLDVPFDDYSSETN